MSVRNGFRGFDIDIPIPTSVSAVISFVGMVNYFRDFITSLSSYLQPLSEIIKKTNCGGNGFEMTENALSFLLFEW